MKASKKVVTAALALVLCLGLSVPVSAAETVVFDSYGITEADKATTTLTGVISQKEMTFNVTSGAAEYAYPVTATVYTVSSEEFSYSEDFVSGLGSEYNHTGSETLFYIGGLTEKDGIYFDEEIGGYNFSEFMESGSESEKEAYRRYDLILKPEYAEEYDMFHLLGSGTDFYVILDNTVQPEQTTNNDSLFSDVLSNAYYYDAVKWAVENRITSGTSATTFSPDTTCTTAQILTFLWRANGSPEPTTTAAFTDIPADAYYAKAAAWAAEKGMVSGTTFGGDTPCTRLTTVSYLWQLAGQPTAAESAAFTDLPANEAVKQAVSWAVEQGITSGTGTTTFSPDDICTRGQIVTFLYRNMK